jgi:hypothetical protein
MLYGLHNRDYPTLWATRVLIAIAAEKGIALPWREFTGVVLEAAWNVGAQLAKMDTERSGNEQKASVGFPFNAEKRQSSEARFLEHMIGVPDRPSGPSGPIFSMKLAGLKRTGDSFLVAPTALATELLSRLEKAGVGLNSRPPYTAEAWLLFGEHLRKYLTADYDAWVRVLRVVAERPGRDELVARFASVWAGAAAGTNVAGYVSRGREWGLIAPKLDGGKYALTDEGRAVVEGRRK